MYYPLLTSVLQSIFQKAFSDGLEPVHTEVLRIADFLCGPIAVIFCGGSYFYNNGLALAVDEIMTELGKEIRKL